jgi:hypothetical protein
MPSDPTVSDGVTQLGVAWTNLHEHCDWPRCKCWCDNGPPGGTRPHPAGGHHQHWGPNTPNGAGDGYPSAPAVEASGDSPTEDECPEWIKDYVDRMADPNFKCGHGWIEAVKAKGADPDAPNRVRVCSACREREAWIDGEWKPALFLPGRQLTEEESDDGD